MFFSFCLDFFTQLSLLLYYMYILKFLLINNKCIEIFITLLVLKLEELVSERFVYTLLNENLKIHCFHTSNILKDSWAPGQPIKTHLGSSLMV